MLVEGANAALLDIDFGILLASFFCLEVPGNLSSFLAFVAMKPSFFLCVLFLLDSSAFSAILRLEDLAGFTALQRSGCSGSPIPCSDAMVLLKRTRPAGRSRIRYFAEKAVEPSQSQVREWGISGNLE